MEECLVLEPARQTPRFKNCACLIMVTLIPHLVKLRGRAGETSEPGISIQVISGLRRSEDERPGDGKVRLSRRLFATSDPLSSNCRSYQGLSGNTALLAVGLPVICKPNRLPLRH